jgi:hypothetical protein
MRKLNVVQKRAGTILSDDIDKYCLSFCVVFMASVRELNCHNVYVRKLQHSAQVNGILGPFSKCFH